MGSGVEFNGTQFDDLLQAQWAVFFDAIGVKWQYRAYSLPLDSMRDYSPQFRIWIHGEDYWFEALPRLSFAAFSEICPCLSFAATLRDLGEDSDLPQAGGGYVVSFGPVGADGADCGMFPVYDIGLGERGRTVVADEQPQVWAQCPSCGQIGLWTYWLNNGELWWTTTRSGAKCCEGVNPEARSPDLMKAYLRARSFGSVLAH